MSLSNNTQPIASHDYLEVDLITVPGQNYALASFVSPQSRQKGDACGMKLRGVFATREEAQAHAKLLMKMDNTFDIYLYDMYKWVLIPPDPSMIDDQEYQEGFLNEMIKGYRQNNLEAKQHFAERKRKLMEEGLNAVLTEEERIPEPKPGDGPQPDSVLDIFSVTDPLLKSQEKASGSSS